LLALHPSISIVPDEKYILLSPYIGQLHDFPEVNA
jgi:hypothetical protein